MRKFAIPSLFLIIIGILVTRVEFEPVQQETPEVETPKEAPPKLERVAPGLRDVTPSRVLPVPLKEDELLERLPGVEPPPPPPPPVKPSIWRSPRVIAVGLISSGSKTIRLTGINPLPLDHRCEDDLGNNWPCGMLGRTELRQFVRGRAIECEPIENKQSAPEIRTSCKLANQDIAGWIVRLGWATPAGGRYLAEFEEAKKNRRGQWRARAPGK